MTQAWIHKSEEELRPWELLDSQSHRTTRSGPANAPACDANRSEGAVILVSDAWLDAAHEDENARAIELNTPIPWEACDVLTRGLGEQG